MSDRIEQELAAQGPANGGGNVDRIRDILFGSQMREYERRIDELEKRLSADNERLRQELEQRIDKVETFFRQEMQRLADRQKVERKERLEALSDTQSKIASLEEHLSERVESLEDSGGQERLALRSEILEQSKQLSDAIHSRAEELRVAMDQETRRLQADKTGRDELSRLMGELAMRLSGEFQLPDA